MHNKKLNLNDSTLNEKTSPLHIILHIIHISKGGPDATLDFVKLRGLISFFPLCRHQINAKTIVKSLRKPWENRFNT